MYRQDSQYTGGQAVQELPAQTRTGTGFEYESSILIVDLCAHMSDDNQLVITQTCFTRLRSPQSQKTNETQQKMPLSATRTSLQI